jgi:hypothetical protein
MPSCRNCRGLSTVTAVIVNDCFIMGKPDPNNVDLILILPADTNSQTNCDRLSIRKKSGHWAAGRFTASATVGTRGRLLILPKGVV